MVVADDSSSVARWDRAPRKSSKVAKPCFDYRCGSGSLRFWERHPSWGQVVCSRIGPAYQKTAKRTVLCWSGMTNTEHNGLYVRKI